MGEVRVATIRNAAFLLLTGVSIALARYPADEFGGVSFAIPAGWKSEKTVDAIALAPGDALTGEGVVVVIGKSEGLANKALRVWFDAKVAENESSEEKLLSASEVVESPSQDQSSCLQVRVSQTKAATQIRMFYGVGNRKSAALAIAVAGTEKAFDKYLEPVKALFASMKLISSEKALNSKQEKVPLTSLVNGRPQGIWLGRSLLSGKTVCLLFLSEGRITRHVPDHGFEQFDWETHKKDHSGDCGTWNLEGKTLSVRWGDGGVHSGDLKTSPEAIEFYGKRYSKPRATTVAEMAGKWEATRAISGAQSSSSLQIETNGAFVLEGTVGVNASGVSAASSRVRKGKIIVKGMTAILEFDGGAIEHYTLLAAQGTPLTVFGLGTDLFVRR